MILNIGRKLIYIITLARLRGGMSQLEGRLEIYYQGVWRSVCTQHWTLKEAHVACRMMGYHSALYANTIYGSFDRQVGIKDLRCNGSEKDLVGCQHNGWNLQGCQDKKYAIVTCSRKYILYIPTIIYFFLAILLSFLYSS